MPKPMNKFFKFVLIAGGIFLGVLVLLMGGVAIYIHVNYPPEKLKAIAIEKLSETLKRKVTVGDVQFNVFSGFNIANLKISNRPGWSEGSFVTAKDISISYKLFPLLWGQIALGEVRLNQPEILVERRGLNQFNFSDMAGDSSAQVSAPPPLAQPVAKPAVKSKGKSKAKPKKKSKHKAALNAPTNSPAFSSLFVEQAFADTLPSASSGTKPSKSTLLISVDTVNIVHGKMVYLDETSSPAQQSNLEDLNLKIKNISMIGGKTTFSLSTPFTVNKVPYQLSIDGAFRYFLASQSIKEIKLEGKVNDLGFDVSGDALNLTSNFTPNMDGSASLNMLKVSGLIPGSLSAMPEGLAIDGPAKVSFHLDGSSAKGLKLKGVADAADLSIRYKDLFIKEAKTTCKLEFTSVRGQDFFELPSFHATFQDWELDGFFHYQNRAYFSGALRSKSLPLKGISKAVPKFSKATFSGDASLNLKFSEPLGKHLALNMDGQMGLRGIGAALPQDPNVFQGLTGTVVLKGAVIKMTEASFKTFDGKGAASMIFNLGVSPTAYSYALSLRNVSAQEAVNGGVDVGVAKNPQDYKDKVFGLMNFDYKGTGSGFSGTEMEKSANGSGAYNITNAKVKGFSIIKIINGIFNDKSDEINSEKIEGTIAVKNQVASYTGNSTGKVGTIKVVGGINFDAVYTPDMKIRGDIGKQFLSSQVMSKLPPGIDPSCVADTNGNVPVDFKFTGPAKENNWSYDWDRLLKNVGDCIGRKAQVEIKKKTDEIGQDLGNKLKGLFGK